MGSTVDDPVYKYLLGRFKETFPGSEPTIIDFDFGAETKIGLYPEPPEHPTDPHRIVTHHKILLDVQYGPMRLVTEKDQEQWMSLAIVIVCAAKDGLEKYGRCEMSLRVFK